MTASPLLLAQVLLVLVLVASGSLKLAEAQATRDAFVGLRLPSWLSSSAAPALLPYAELVLAALLLVAPGRPGLAANTVALAMFTAYLVVVWRAVRFEEPVSCSCFGRLGLGTLTWATVVRNALLVMLALAALGRGRAGPSPLSELRALDARMWGWLALSLLAVVLGALVAGAGYGDPSSAVSHDGDDYARQPIPYGMLRQPDDQLVSLRDLSRSAAVLLVFLTHGCGPCLRVMTLLAAFDATNPEVETRAVFHEDRRDSVVEERLGVPWLADPGGVVTVMFGGNTPSAVLLGADGLLAGGPVFGEPDVAELLEAVSEQLAESREAVA